MILQVCPPISPTQVPQDTIFVDTFEDFLQKFLVIFMITLLSSFALLGGLSERAEAGGRRPKHKR